MENLLQLQYTLIKESREVVFNYLELEVKEDLLIPLPAFNGKNIRYMLVHIANTYVAWISNFILKGDLAFFSEEEILFTHVITHEFHHKGQAMTMSRLLGHTPPDTDIMIC